MAVTFICLLYHLSVSSWLCRSMAGTADTKVHSQKCPGNDKCLVPGLDEILFCCSGVLMCHFDLTLGQVTKLHNIGAQFQSVNAVYLVLRYLVLPVSSRVCWYGTAYLSDLCNIHICASNVAHSSKS